MEMIDPEWTIHRQQTKLSEVQQKLDIAVKALEMVVNLAEDPLASDNPMIHAYLTTAKIAKTALDKIGN